MATLIICQAFLYSGTSCTAGRTLSTVSSGRSYPVAELTCWTATVGAATRSTAAINCDRREARFVLSCLRDGIRWNWLRIWLALLLWLWPCWQLLRSWRRRRVAWRERVTTSGARLLCPQPIQVLLIPAGCLGNAFHIVWTYTLGKALGTWDSAQATFGNISPVKAAESFCGIVLLNRWVRHDRWLGGEFGRQRCGHTIINCKARSFGNAPHPHGTYTVGISRGTGCGFVAIIHNPIPIIPTIIRFGSFRDLNLLLLLGLCKCCITILIVVVLCCCSAGCFWIACLTTWTIIIQPRRTRLITCLACQIPTISAVITRAQFAV